jgi:hypothetical protein
MWSMMGSASGIAGCSLSLRELELGRGADRAFTNCSSTLPTSSAVSSQVSRRRGHARSPRNRARNEQPTGPLCPAAGFPDQGRLNWSPLTSAIGSSTSTRTAPGAVSAPLDRQCRRTFLVCSASARLSVRARRGRPPRHCDRQRVGHIVSDIHPNRPGSLPSLCEGVASTSVRDRTSRRRVEQRQE